jgi:photosystem II stability/assembly factor-like uncharacterized protein
LANEQQTAFISYARQDSSEFALQLAEDLKAAGAAVWLDQLDIVGGELWDNAVQQAMTSCPRMLVILSPASDSSSNVLDEVSYALKKLKTVIPVLYRDCEIPFRLDRIQHLDFRSDYARGLRGLLRTLLAQPPSDQDIPPPKRSLPLASEERRPEAVAQIKASDSVWSTTNANRSAHTNDISDISNDLNSVAFVNARCGWAVGEKGMIVHTEDGGKTWQEQASGTKNVLNSVSFVDTQHGWSVGDYGTLLHTEDGGIQWKEMQDDHAWRRWLSVVFVDAQQGWAACERGIAYTKDGGITWLDQTYGEGRLSSITFANTQCGWAVGDEGAILHTVDGGQTWKKQASGTDRWLFSVAFVNAQRGWAVGATGTILHTKDGGQVWHYQTNPAFRFLCSVAFVNAQGGWVVGEDGTILHTEDGGRTWKEQVSGTKENLNSIAFVGLERGWAVGRYGTILHTEDGGETWRRQAHGT